MKKFAEAIVRWRWAVLAVWLVAAILIISLSPQLSSVESNDQSSFLPKNYESIEAANVAQQAVPHSQNGTDTIVFKRAGGGALTPGDQQTVERAAGALNNQHLPHVLSVSTNARELAPSRTVQLGQVVYDGNPDDTPTINAVKTVRQALSRQLAGTGLTAATTGQESMSYDTQDSATKALKIVSMGTLLLVLLLPAFVFRSPFAGLLPIVSVGLVYSVASSLLAATAKTFNFHVNQQLSVIFTVVLFGIGTDYILFLLFRYRERLRTGDHTRAAVSFALSRAGEAILSAALVVLVSFAALFFAKFGIFSSMAPGLVICVAVMMLAALTLIPALVAIVGQKVFWPSKAWRSASLNPTVSKKIGGALARRPGLMAGGVAVVLVLLAACTLWYKSDFSSFSQPPKGTQSASAYNDLTAAFPAGVLAPTQVYVTGHNLTSGQLQPLVANLQKAQGVSSVTPAVILPGQRTAALSVTLKDDPYSARAISTVAGPLHTAAHSASLGGAKVYVGGATAIVADIKKVTDRDLRVIFPVAAAFIFIILAVLLRSLVAPVFLLVAVGLGYLATLGATTLIFMKLGGNAGIISFIPLFMYLFVVAIGTDYNILTVTRLREEVREGHQPRKAADLTVEHSSATVASAGLILAATFGSLMLAGMSFLTQMGAAIAIGVALAAFVIAPLLIPSVSALVGYALWWPGHRPGKKTGRH